MHPTTPYVHEIIVPKYIRIRRLLGLCGSRTCAYILCAHSEPLCVDHEFCINGREDESLTAWAWPWLYPTTTRVQAQKNNSRKHLDKSMEDVSNAIITVVITQKSLDNKKGQRKLLFRSDVTFTIMTVNTWRKHGPWLRPCSSCLSSDRGSLRSHVGRDNVHQVSFFFKSPACDQSWKTTPNLSSSFTITTELRINCMLRKCRLTFFLILGIKSCSRNAARTVTPY